MNNMATTLHTFMDIFNTDFEVDEEIVQLKKIVIPIIQRDYAQGRTDADTQRVRNRFLDSLYAAITEKPITLDFVYGDIDENGVMTPLDGQQRLTTLFLLHWYAAKKENIEISEYDFLKNFSYETRYSARDFCGYIIDLDLTFERSISEKIEDQAWFPLDWKKDSTISAMLVMLDAINDRFKEVPNLWDKLKEKAISFYFLPIKDMGLTDELYIKMNSRGKPLTQFEHFKAELEHELRKIDEEISKRVIRKIDIEWTDMLWGYRGDDNVIDDEFLRYFRFVCDIICYQSGGTTQGQRLNEFDILNDYFSTQNDKAKENVITLEKYFDCWCDVEKTSSPKEFLERYISGKHEPGKVKFEKEVDIFGDCLQNYADVYGNGNRTFPLNRIILLYAIVTYLNNKEKVTEEQFRRRFRVILNLVHNSEDEISDSEQRSSGNRMPAILRQVDSIIVHGVINDKEENNFNTAQLEEEKEKDKWVEDNPELAEDLYEIEDHQLLHGQIAILGLDNPENFKKFASLYACNWDLVDCALVATGDYKQCERNGWRHQFGSSKIDKAWISLFHRSANQGFSSTKKILAELFDKSDAFSDEVLLKIKDDFIAECENNSRYEWRYYYVKYDDFRPGRYGKYSWENLDLGFYNMHVFWTESKWSENSYQPFLYVADSSVISRDDLGHYSVIGDKVISCENDGFHIYKAYTDLKEELDLIAVKQSDDGIDIENRIIKLKKYLAENK